jgi:hypothetical protein
MNCRGLIVSVVAVLVCAAPAAAQSVALQFDRGRVTLRAQNTPVRAILAEWAKLGGTIVVNGERVAGQPVTLELTDVPERQALDIILRSVAGYMLAPRRAGTTGASAFDRIMILPTSAAPQNPPPPTAAGARPGLPRPAPVVRPPALEAGLEPPEPPEPADTPNEADARGNGPVVTPRLMPPIGGRPVPPTTIEPADNNEQEDDSDAQPQGGVVTVTPANPFGIPSGSSTTPGVISPAPKPQQQQQPNQPGTRR